ncbi:hypothetical protein SERLA73DRAFT_183829 [Serpula lacrymans var. lacrymans S7.3]|uniref:Uncharacterized protein n=2 Tax=Serpula lacrymans var. lacrymans TaxID=341189 RepID=F8Q1X3_SERL3|nr:uncharacterized protein SERLADRAFT_471215 [Serpula lacrymans var. lacrymans S7.9]EGN97184.1 hypothetical protein SERLA73DRAFT_183829 [Serpula lacrymans var. lacrymans S7.3]EGO22792.1 hypothetical protein SERLADRAFT_471215 [Serpula lacrymans var. lacrymans S7.9]
MPSGPWPWINFDVDLKPGQPSKEIVPFDKSWKGYPQSIFPNWTPEQVARSEMLIRCLHSGCCSIYSVDVKDDGSFVVGETENFKIWSTNEEEIWSSFQADRPEGIRVRALFVDKMTVPILKMLGKKYTIEPFFFSSSTNWIPSRYQEEVKPGEGDHITITLPFIRAVQCPPPQSATVPSTTGMYPRHSPDASQHGSIDSHEIIDTQSPLFLRSSRHILMLDLLSLHMVRSTTSSTIISYHPDSDSHRTGAEQMEVLLYSIGKSVYWQNVLSKTSDPTFVLLSILWYALYAWDESFEILYAHINILESSVITTNEMRLTRELHIIQAHLLFYATLLQDFTKSVIFVLETPHPATETLPHDEKQRHERQASKDLLKKECRNLLSAIERLEGIRDIHSKRLQNVMNLAFATVNIDDSKQMKELTKATLRDSTAMKQISYLTMIFLPANFTATVFGMNVKEINPQSYGSLAHYAITTVLLTLATIWIVVTFQRTSHFHGSDPDVGFWIRLCWPVRFIQRNWVESKQKWAYRQDQKQDVEKGSIPDE